MASTPAVTESVRKKSRPAPEIHELMPLYDVGGSHYLGYRMVIAGKLFDRCINRVLAEHCDLTLPEWRAMAQLGLLPSGTVRSLSNGAAVDRAEVSRALRDLQARGLVERRANGEDLRSPVFSLTPQGRQLFSRVRKPIGAFINDLVEGMDEQDIEIAGRVLVAITRGCLEQT